MSVYAIVTCYGADYVPFTAALIESVIQQKMIPVVTTVHGPGRFPPHDDYYKSIVLEPKVARKIQDGVREYRVAHKIVGWEGAFESIPVRSPMVFLDSDTLVLKSLDPIWYGRRLDFGYTVRSGRWRLNAGVVFATQSARMHREFQRWVLYTDHILDSDMKRLQAQSLYGTADQAALHQLICQMEDNGGLMVLPFEWNLWNNDQFYEKDVGFESSAIIHLKDVRRHLFLDPSTTEERILDCYPAFRVWLSYYDAFINRTGIRLTEIPIREELERL